MSGVWNRTLVYLGLREEPDEVPTALPERFVPEDDPHAEHAPPRPTSERGSRGSATEREEAAADRRRAGRDPAASVPPSTSSGSEREGEPDNVLSLRTGDVHVRAVADVPVARAAVVDVAEFDDVEAVGARYRTGQPVVFDLTSADRATARRVVDFVSGLTYVSRGELTKVGGRAFLVVPSGLTLPADERRRLGELGYRLPTGSDA